MSTTRQTEDTKMAAEQNQHLNENRNDGIVWMNVMDDIEEYERVTNEWNQSIEVQERRERRNRMINNTDGYRRGNEVHHILTIQMYDPADWNALFGNEILNPIISEYARGSMEWMQDDIRIHPFAGQMEVSLLMQDNYRPGVHAAIFFVYLIPHRKYRDGHMIQIEFGEGSNTHQNINRLFDTNTRAVVMQATQYQMLGFLADDDEAMDLLYSCFMDNEFIPRRYSYVVVVPMPGNENFNNGNEDYEYIVDPNANNDHRWHHEFYHNERRPARLQLENEVVAHEVAPVAIPPPPPVNDFAAIYEMNLALYDNNINNIYNQDNFRG